MLQAFKGALYARFCRLIGLDPIDHRACALATQHFFATPP